MIHTKKWMVVPYESDDEKNENVKNKISDSDRILNIQQDIYKNEQKETQLKQPDIVEEIIPNNIQIKQEVDKALKQVKEEENSKQEEKAEVMKNIIQEKDVVIKKLTSVIDERLSKKTSKNNKRKKVEFDINSSSYVKNPSESTRLKKKSHQLKKNQELKETGNRFARDLDELNPRRQIQATKQTSETPTPPHLLRFDRLEQDNILIKDLDWNFLNNNSNNVNIKKR